MQETPVHRQDQGKALTRRAASDRGDLSPTRLARMHAALQRHVDSGVLPGLVALIHHRGREHVEVIGTTAFGLLRDGSGHRRAHCLA